MRQCCHFRHAGKRVISIQFKQMAYENDAGYKLLFSTPELVQDLVLGFIPDDWLHGLDYSTLEKLPGSYVTDDYRQRADDVV